VGAARSKQRQLKPAFYYSTNANLRAPERKSLTEAAG
jgi:hypothetical protein